MPNRENEGMEEARLYAYTCILENKVDDMRNLITLYPEVISTIIRDDESTLCLSKAMTQLLLEKGITPNDIETYNNKVKKNLLKEEFLQEDINKENKLHIALKNNSLDKLIEKDLALLKSVDLAELLIKTTITAKSPTTQEKKKLLSLIKKHLSKVTNDEIKELAKNVFQEKLHNPEYLSTSFNAKKLRKEDSFGDNGVKIYNKIDVELIELLYIVGGINLKEYENFIERLPSIKDDDLKNWKDGPPLSAVILESNKQQILQIIRNTDNLNKLIENPSNWQVDEEDIFSIKNLALKRFCFLINNIKDTEKLKDLGTEVLLNLAKLGNECVKYDFDSNFKKHLIDECGNFENLKEIINSEYIEQKFKSKEQFISELDKLEDSFKTEEAILTNKFEKLLDPNAKYILSRKSFLNLIRNTKEKEISDDKIKLIKDNLKFFSPNKTFKTFEYDKSGLEDPGIKDSIKYYKNNPDSLIPNLRLLKIANDGNQISKLKDILSNQYVKVKSTVGKCLDVILKCQEYCKSLRVLNLDIDLVKKDLLNKLPELTIKIIEELKADEVENIKNITFSCKEINQFLDISPITSLFEEYNNNYQGLELEVNNAQEILGDLKIEYNFN